MKVGFVGLGDLGGPTAYLIAKAGWPLYLWARRAEALEPFKGTGAELVPTLKELGAQVDVMGVMVTADADVEEVILGDNLPRRQAGLLAGMRPGSTIVVFSTVSPETCQRLEQLAAEREVALLDAPVANSAPLIQKAVKAGFPLMSRSAIPTEPGLLTIMVGGDRGAFERVLPVLESVGEVFHLGAVGSGQRAKLINNLLFGANVALGEDAVRVGVQLGLDKEALTTLLRKGGARSYGLDFYALGKTAVLGSGGMLRKDVTLAEKLLRQSGLQSTLLEAAAEQALIWAGEAAQREAAGASGSQTT